MGEPQPDGKALQKHLEAAANAGDDKAKADLSGPALQEHCVYLAEWFCALSAARTGNGYGPNCLGFEAISAWARLTRRELTAWEAETLAAMDRAWMDEPKPAKEDAR